MGEITPADRECPGCGTERVCSAREAQRAYNTTNWQGSVSMLDYAEYVCPVCKAVRISGDWTRMLSVNERAWELAQASSTKSKEQYQKRLTAGSGSVD